MYEMSVQRMQKVDLLLKIHCQYKRGKGEKMYVYVHIAGSTPPAQVWDTFCQELINFIRIHEVVSE